MLEHSTWLLQKRFFRLLSASLAFSGKTNHPVDAALCKREKGKLEQRKNKQKNFKYCLRTM